MEIETSVSHFLGEEIAVNRLHKMVDSLEVRFRDQVHHVQSQWHGNELDISFDAYGFQIQCHATVLSDRVALMGRIPATAKMFRGKIEQAIVARVEAILQDHQIPKAA